MKWKQQNQAHPKGADYEQAAQQYLTKQGLTIICCNYRCRGGELDIVAQHKDTLVFVEVKYRSNPNYGHAIEQVTASKQQRLVHAAKHFLSKHKKFQQHPARFDIVAMHTAQNALQFTWLQHAFY